MSQQLEIPIALRLARDVNAENASGVRHIAATDSRRGGIKNAAIVGDAVSKRGHRKSESTLFLHVLKRRI